MNNTVRGLLAFVPTIIFLGIFFYWPLIKILSIVISAGLESIVLTLNNPLFPRFFSFTLLQAMLTTIGSLLVGLPTGFLLARADLYGSRFLRAAVTVPFLFPPLVILLGFVILFEPAGVLASIISSWKFSPFSFWGIVLAHILYNISLVSRITEGAFKSEPASYHQLAGTLGASRWMKLRTITIPHIKPALESAILLVFLYAFNSFAIVLILGEVRLQTIEVMIYNQSRLRFNIEQASVLAIFQLLINLVIIAMYTHRNSYTQLEDDGQRLQQLDQRTLPTLAVFGVVLLTWAPVIFVFRTTIRGLIEAPEAIRNQLFTGQFDRFLGTSSLRVLGNTLFFGLSVSILAVFLGGSAIFASYLSDGDFIEKISIPLTLLPMGTSAITVSFGLIQTHGKFSFFSDLVYIYIIAAQLIAALPFASRALFSTWERVPKDLILVSNTLGMGELGTFKKVVIPYLKPALLVACLF